MEQLSKKNIFLQVHYMPIYKHPFYHKQNYLVDLCSASENYYNKALSLPLYYSLTDDEFEFVIEAIQSLILNHVKK